LLDATGQESRSRGNIIPHGGGKKVRSEALWWWQAAQRDLMMALSLQKAEPFEGVAFHAQQAAEKGLKAATIATGHL